MASYPSLSLCISTYNWPQALELCLMSVLNQSYLPAEIVIGDDGSTDDTKLLIDKYRSQCPIPIRHVWHPDNGFQLAQIRNKSFAAATGEYIIQVDGDLILHKHFVQDHVRFARRGSFLAGTRSMLNEENTTLLLKSRSIGVNSVEKEKRYNAIRLPLLTYLMFYLQTGTRQSRYVLGANMSFWKEDLLKVNGYNEDFTGWGKEDNDLAIRLCNAGTQLHFLKFSGLVYHLHHRVSSTDRMEENERLLQYTMDQKISTVSNGMNKYL